MGPDVTRKPDKLLVVIKQVMLNQLGSCDPENEHLLLATLWLLIANSLLGNIWENSEGVTMVKYLESCICKHNQRLAHAVAMVSYYYDVLLLHTIAIVTAVK